MSTAVTLNNQGIDFGELPPGSRGRRTYAIDPAPADALITATIGEGSTAFKVNGISVFDRVLEEIDPSELPPHFKPGRGGLPKVPVLHLVQETDGSTAIVITKGQRVVIDIDAFAPIDSFDTDTIYGWLLVQGGTWDPIGVPLSLTVAQTITTFRTASVTIAQGEEADVPISVRRAFGPDTVEDFNLHFGPESHGVSMIEQRVHLNRRETKNVFLHFSVELDAELGRRDLLIYGGGGRSELALTVGHPKFLVSLQSPDIKARRGVSIDVAIDIDPKTHDSILMWFTPSTLPAGFSMASHGFSITGPSTVHLTLVVASDAPETSSPLTIDWTADGAEQTGTLAGTATLRNEQIIYDTGPVETGSVHGWAQLAIQDNGDWSYRGHVHEDGIVGDDYVFAIGINQLGDGGQLKTFAEQGKLGGTVAIGGPSRDDDWDQNNHDAWIAENWDAIKQKGVTGRLHVATDPVQALEFALELLPIVVGAIAISVFASDPDTECTWGGGLTPGDQGGSKEGVGVEGRVTWAQ